MFTDAIVAVKMFTDAIVAGHQSTKYVPASLMGMCRVGTSRGLAPASDKMEKPEKEDDARKIR
jgi:hypothetical protein